MDVLVGVTNLERQSAALFQAPEFHSKEMFYVVSSRLHLLTLLLVFFPLRKHASSLWLFWTMMASFRWRKVAWCSGVQSNLTCCLVRRVRGLAILANPLINFL